LVRDKSVAPNDYSLYDFFGQARAFTPIAVASPPGYPTDCFTTQTSQQGCFPNTSPAPPDDDVLDND
jgi:hypothetical protein